MFAEKEVRGAVKEDGSLRVVRGSTFDRGCSERSRNSCDGPEKIRCSVRRLRGVLSVIHDSRDVTMTDILPAPQMGLDLQDEDAGLLRRFAEEGEQPAFNELVRRHMDVVYSAALRRVGGDSHLARDVAQHVFVVLARQAGKLARHPALVGWLYSATRHAAANTVRAEHRRRRREAEASTMQQMLSDPASPGQWDEVKNLLDAALDSLNEGDRLAVLLRFFEHRTYAQTGATLRLSEDAARMKVERAVGKLRSWLARRGVHSSAAALAAGMSQFGACAAPAGLVGSMAEWVAAYGAMGGSAATVSVLPFPRVTLSAAWVVAIVALTVGLIALRHVTAQTDRAQGELAVARNRLATLTAMSATSAPSEPNSEQVVARARSGLARASVTSGSRTGTSAGAKTSSQTNLRLAGGRRTVVRAMYDEFYKDAAFTPAEIEAFELTSVQGPGRALWLFDVTADDAALTATLPAELTAGQMADRLRTLLGEERYRRYLDYQRTIPARLLAAEVAGNVYLDAPLGREQAAQLIRTLTDASASYLRGGAVEAATLDWDAAFREAAQFLTPAQFEALVDVKDQQLIERAIVMHLEKLLGSEDGPQP